MKKKEAKLKSIPRRFFTDRRLEIGRILIDELQGWESAKKPTSEEFYRLVDRLFKH